MNHSLVTTAYKQAKPFSSHYLLNCLTCSLITNIKLTPQNGSNKLPGGFKPP